MQKSIYGSKNIFHAPHSRSRVRHQTLNLHNVKKRVIKFLQHLSSQLMWNRQIIELIFISPSRARCAVDEMDCEFLSAEI
jgi:hypothetical protein